MENNDNENAKKFYIEALSILNESPLTFLLGGAFAIFNYTGIYRDTKDLDLFCKPGEYTSILKTFQDHGFEIEVTDPRWLAKARREEYFIDIIFSTTNNRSSVNEDWINRGVEGKLFGLPVKFISPEDLFCSKVYVQGRERYDGSDLNHLILKKGKAMNWELIMNELEIHWQLLLAQIMNFQFVYPSERDIIPKSIVDALIEKIKEQYDIPPPHGKICRGPFIDHYSYGIDIKEWGYNVITLLTV